MIGKNSLPNDKYEDLHKESVENPEKFWEKVADSITWTKPWTRVLDNSKQPFTKWFVGGELNACYNAVDRHVATGKGAKTALIYDSPLTGISQKISYVQLQQKVAKLAGVLSKFGVVKGDRVLIYMPSIPETVISMLATARLGAVHSVVFGGFAACELCTRIEHSLPKVIISADCGIEPNKIVPYLENLMHALKLSKHKPKKCVIYQRRIITGSSKLIFNSQHLFVDWDLEMLNSDWFSDCISVEANDPLYILYTSGTTGNPKGVERPTGGHLVSLLYTMKCIYGLNSSDVWWTTSDFGWVVGHSYMCYAPLLFGITSVIYEGKPTIPDPSQYFKIIHKYKVNAIFTVPTALRMIKKEDPKSVFGCDFDISSLRTVFVAGEHCDLSTKLWASKIFNCPVLNHWWQTETGHAITATCVGLNGHVEAQKLTTGLPFIGFKLEVLRDDGSKAKANELGRIAAKLPLPPGNFSTLFKADDKFVSHYFQKFPGYYDTMDAGYMDEDGLIYVTARDDDVINVAGHRLSTLSIENVILSHPDIGDACVVSVPDDVKNEVPFCFFVPKNLSGLDEQLLVHELVQMVREAIGPVASFKYAAAVRALPQTRSGKICRKSISELARGQDVHKMLSTVVDPSVYLDVEKILQKFGFIVNNNHLKV